MFVTEYLWEITTIVNGKKYTELFATQDETVTSASSFFSMAEGLGGYSISGATVEDAEIRMVHYNHSKGNKVVINLVDDNNENHTPGEIVSITDDFVLDYPDSIGATYEFITTYGKQTLVVGQTYGGREFYGTYSFNGQTVVPPESCGCNVSKNNYGQWYTRCDHC